MSTIVECDWSPSGQNFVKSRKQSLQTVSHNAIEEQKTLHNNVDGLQNETLKEDRRTGIDLYTLYLSHQQESAKQLVVIGLLTKPADSFYQS